MYQILISVLAGMIAALASYLAGAIAIRRKRQATDASEAYLSRLSELYMAWLETTGRHSAPGSVKEVLRAISDRTGALAKSPFDLRGGASKEEIDATVNQRLDQIKKRISDIEKRFPEEATIEKIASVNDAILATQIEALRESLSKTEERLLTKWDVTKIMFEILAILGVLTGAVFAVLEYL